MKPLLFVAAVFATYRIAILLADEEGPLGLAVWMRGKLDPDQRTWLGRGANCRYCVSFWVALVVAWFARGMAFDLLLVLWWLAVAGVCYAVMRMTTK